VREREKEREGETDGDLDGTEKEKVRGGRGRR